MLLPKPLKNSKLIFKNFSLVLCVAVAIYFFLPFITISFYNVPQADDFCSNSIVWFDYLSHVSNWYQNINGRYFNAIINSLPFWYNSEFYPYLFFLFGGFFLYAIFLLTSLVLHSSRSYIRLFITFFLFIIFFLYTPQISSGFYWLSGLTTYLFPFTIFILFIVTIVKFFTKKGRRINYKYLTCLILMFIAIGSHEVTMSFVVISSIINFIYCFKTNKNLSSSIFLMIFSFVCSSLVLFSPGTAHRRLNYSDAVVNTNIFVETFIDVFNYLKFSLTKELIVISILLIVNFSILLNQDKINLRLNPIPSFLMLVASIIIVIFVFNYSTGTFDPLIRNRYSNILFYYSSLTWFIFLLSITQKLNSIGLKTILLKNRVPIYFISSVLFFIIIYNSFNYKNANWLLRRGTIQNYYKEWNARKDFVQQYHKNMDTLFVPRYNNFPVMLYFDDLTHNGKNWKNSCYSENYSAGKSVIMDDYRFNEWLLSNYKFDSKSIIDHFVLISIRNNEARNFNLPIIGNTIIFDPAKKNKRSYNIEISSNNNFGMVNWQLRKKISFKVDSLRANQQIKVPDFNNLKVNIYTVEENGNNPIFLKNISLGSI